MTQIALFSDGASKQGQRLSYLFRVSICFMIVPQLSTSQVDSAFGFYPLNTGDIHQFRYSYTICNSSPPPTYHLEKVVGDTLLPNGRVYKIVLSTMPGESATQFVRVDSASANVYQYVSFPSPGEQLMDSLRSTLNSVFYRTGWGPTRCTVVDTITLFGLPSIVKRFLLPLVPHADYSLAYGFGRIQYIDRADDPCYPLLINYRRDLMYAKISGNEYGTLVGVAEKGDMIPSEIQLSQNYPNPFNGETTIAYSIPTGGRVVIEVSDILGRRVATAVDDYRSAGNHSFRWSGNQLASGVYFYSLHALGLRLTKIFVLMK